MRWKERIFRQLCRVSGLLCLLLLLFILLSLILSGIPALDFSFVTESAENFGSEGGIRDQILGSLLLILGTALVTAPLALGTALFLSELLRKERWRRSSELHLQILNGVPSIIFGLFGLILFVGSLGLGVSWTSGVFVLSSMILPLATLSTYHAARSTPSEERKAAKSLGLGRWEWIRKGVMPRARKGLSTGLMLGLARAIGETAPIMFVATAFSGAGIPASFRAPVATLPTHILELAQQASEEAALRNAWGTALVLILLVMLLSTIAFRVRKNLRTSELEA